MTDNQQYLRWFYVHGGLDCEPYVDLLRAAIDSEYSSEAGMSSESCIEGPNGIVPDSEVRAVLAEESARREARRAKSPLPPIVAQLMVREPHEGHESPEWRPKWAEYDSYRAIAAMERDRAELVAMLGEDRVEVREFHPVTGS